MKFVGKLFGGLFGGDEKVSSTATEDTTAEQRRAKTGRSALYKTGGGAAGEELNPDEVKRRNTLLGN